MGIGSRRSAARPGPRPASPSVERSGAQPAGAPSSHSRIVMWRGACSPVAQLARELAEQAVALGDDVVLVDRLEVLLAREHERVVAEAAELLDRHPHHLAHAVLDEARAAVRLLDDLDLVGALHQLVDLRAHRATRRSPAGARPRRRRRSPRGSRRRACRGRAGCGSRRARARRRARSRRSVKPSASSRSRARAVTISCAHGQAVMPCACDADEPAGAALGGHGRAEQRVDLLRPARPRRARSCAPGSGRRS